MQKYENESITMQCHISKLYQTVAHCIVQVFYVLSNSEINTEYIQIKCPILVKCHI